MLLGDEDGGAVVPPTWMERVIEMFEERHEIDQKRLAALADGSSMEGPKKFRC
jgi:hypothetical protein